VTYLGYPNTSGLVMMDYRLTDALADPPGMTEPYHTETLVRLPRVMWCYAPPADTPPVNQLPALTNQFVTFGSFNILSKVTPQVIEHWSKLLAGVPGSRLVLKSNGLDGRLAQERMHRLFAAHGVGPQRLDLLGRKPHFFGHLETYHQVDVGLDTFPYNGTTTTCDAMWMGLPVVAVAGKTHISRVGVSLLTAVGLSELVGADPDAMVQIAAKLAQDIPKLAALRAGMRQRLRNSPLMDAPGLTTQIEKAFRTMWRTWCAKQTGE
jgi:predicted O-linked N-acetylglucosamine transferase (SPINDLY family)